MPLTRLRHTLRCDDMPLPLAPMPWMPCRCCQIFCAIAADAITLIIIKILHYTDLCHDAFFFFFRYATAAAASAIISATTLRHYLPLMFRCCLRHATLLMPLLML